MRGDRSEAACRTGFVACDEALAGGAEGGAAFAGAEPRVTAGNGDAGRRASAARRRCVEQRAAVRRLAHDRDPREAALTKRARVDLVARLLLAILCRLKHAA